MDELSEDDKLIVGRARRMQRFLSQPFFVAEQFTGFAGKYVKLEDTHRELRAGALGRVRSSARSRRSTWWAGSTRRWRRAKKLASVVMQVTVISPEASMFDGEADAVVAPAFDGEVGILPNHAPFMTLLGEGTLTVRRGRIDEPFQRAGRIPPGRGQPGTRRGRTRTRRVACVVTSAEGSWCSPCSAAPERRRRRRRPARRSSRRRTGPSTSHEFGVSLSDPGEGVEPRARGLLPLRRGQRLQHPRRLRGPERRRHPGPPRRRLPHPGPELQRELPARRLAHPRPGRQFGDGRRRLLHPGRHLPRPAVRPGGLRHQVRPLRGPRHRADLRHGDNDVNFALGLGVDIRFSEQWAMRASGGLGDIEGVGISVAYIR